MTQKIDAFTHLSPPGFLDVLEASGQKHVFRQLFANTPTLVDVTQRLQMMDKHGIETHVLVPLPWIEGVDGVYDNPTLSQKAARVCNDGMRTVTLAHPDRFRGVALLPAAAGPQAMVAELERAVDELDMAGGVLFFGPTVKPPDHPDYEPLYQRAEQLDVPLWMHPCRPASYADYPGEKYSKYLIWQTLGWVSDSSVAMARVVLSGVYDRYPDLKLITHHHGALIPTFAHRMQTSWDYFEKNSGMDLEAKIEQPYIDHFRKFYCDTAAFGFEPTNIQLAIDFFGVERVLFGSDTPMDAKSGDIFTPETDRMVGALKVTKAQRQSIYNGNISRLLSRPRHKKAPGPAEVKPARRAASKR